MIKLLPEVLQNRISIDERGCWLWTGRMNRNGYGRAYWYGKEPVVHRLVYEILIGQIPKGLVLDHLCRVRHCCNPEHLEPVTIRENTLRGKAKLIGKA
jgi:hypothetical protein